MARKRTEWIARVSDPVANTTSLVHMIQTDDMEKPEELRRVTLHFEKVAAGNVENFKFHGAEARLGDTTAQSAGTTVAAKLDDAQKLIDHYESGAESWEMRAAKRTVDPEALLKKLLESNPELLAQYAENAAAAIAARQG